MSKFWKAFGKMFDDMDEMFDNMGDLMEHLPKTVSYKSTSTSSITINGKSLEIRTVNGKTTVKVNGKEYIEKK